MQLVTQAPLNGGEQVGAPAGLRIERNLLEPREPA